MPLKWKIKKCSAECAVTGKKFEEGEPFYTLLYPDGATYRREDICQEALGQRLAQEKPFSYWKSCFKPQPAQLPEKFPQDRAEALLRHLIYSPYAEE